MSIDRILPSALALVLLGAAGAHAQTAADCPKCSEWNEPQKPFKVYGNTYYVGTHGLASILITSPDGHVLIDGDTQWSVPQIVANIRALGFRLEDVKLILNSHVHFDHAGGIAELKRLSGAKVAASPFTARALKSGHSGKEDPQFESAPSIEKVSGVETLEDGQTLVVGSLGVTAHFTPGHTPGGTTWTWRSCDLGRCLNMVYADSLTPVSSDNFRFSDSKAYPNVKQDFDKSFTTLSALPCDILLTPHPEASDLWSRLAKRDKGDAGAFVDGTACKRLADTSRENLAQRLAQEANGGPISGTSTATAPGSSSTR